MTIYSIYKVTNLMNNKIYIDKTTNFKRKSKTKKDILNYSH